MFEHPSTIGRVLDLRLRGCGFEPHGRRGVYPLNKDTFFIAFSSVPDDCFYLSNHCMP